MGSKKYVGKCKSIEKVLSTKPVNVALLRKLAISPGGLVHKEIRKRVWPYLLNINDFKINIPNDLYSHEEYRQVCLDVERCGGRFPEDMSDKEKKCLQQELIDIILIVLNKHPELHYYQGYHDICVTFLFVCGKNLSSLLLEKLSTYHLRDFMDPTMDRTANILNYLIPLLEKLNPEFLKFLLKSEVETVFAISWLITWFSYVIDKEEDIERLYDFFLSCHPLMPIYFSVQIIIDNANEIMDGECEMSRVYQLLLNIPRKGDLPLEDLILRASDFYIQFPPSSIIGTSKYYNSNLAVSTFADYALVGKHEQPDLVLKKRLLTEEKLNIKKKSSSRVFNYWPTVKMAAAAVSGALGAAILTMASQVADWGPQFLAYL